MKEIFDDKEILKTYMLFKRAGGIKLNSSFKESLETKIMNKIKEKTKFNSANILFKTLSFGIPLAVIAGVFLLLNQPGIISVAEAKEKVKEKINQMFQKDTIYHEKYKLTGYYNGNPQETITYELWEDENSNRFKNIVDYPNDKTIQIHDGEIYWNYNEQDKTLIKEIYVFNNPLDKDKKKGSKIDLVEKYKKLIESNSIKVSSETINSNPVWTIYEENINVTGTDNQRFTQVTNYSFDKETFNIVKISTYKKDGENLMRIFEQDYQVSETLPRTNENLAIFQFEVVLPSDVIVTEKKLDGMTLLPSETAFIDLIPEKISLSKENRTVTVSSDSLDFNSKTVKLVQLETNVNEERYVEKYDLVNVRGLKTVEEKPKVSISADIPSNIKPGVYKVEVVFPDGQSYISLGKLEITN